MPSPSVQRLQNITSFPQLVKYLRDELEWPIDQDKFEDLVFDWDAAELGLDLKTAAKISEIKQLRPLKASQPWGIFFVKFEPKRLPIVVLRRILSQLVIRKRASAKKSEQQTWQARDLLFISSHGEGGDRQITFAHFNEPGNERDLPTLRVMGWDGDDTNLHLDHVVRTLKQKLTWPAESSTIASWRDTWSSAFVLRPRQVIQTSKDLAIRLADLAKGIRDRARVVLEMESDRGTLRQLHKAFQEALIHDLTESDFADMYAQTITYGLFSAAVAGEGTGTKGGLVAEDLGEQVPVTNPFLRELLGNFLKAGGRKGKIDFDELGVQDVVDLLNSPDTHLDAVLRDFGNRSREEDPVIHFYESFLQEYDRAKKVARGVFYTPQPVVSYIVRSVDELLRSEFGLEDGLADTTTWGEMDRRHKDFKIPDGTSADQAFVQILDPATGTGTFLVEVIDIIHKTMGAKWMVQGHGDKQIASLWNEYVPKHLLTRLHAYELLMAPYAIAHLKVGLKLYETGYRFGSEQRARIYLTNALEPAQNFSGTFEFAIPALAHEAKAVNEIKRHKRFTVVIGNPPYAGISSNMSERAQRIVDAYRIVDGATLNERKLWLQDDYVKFIRKAQTTIDHAGAGIVGYITNHGYLDNPTFRGMRQSLMETFGHLRVLDLHGNANKKEKSPDGSGDENVFEIRQGVAVCLATRNWVKGIVEHADLWGPRVSKYDWFAGHSVGGTVFRTVTPCSPFYFFEPQNTNCREEYEAGFKLTEAMPLFGLGFQSSRDHLVVAFDKRELVDRIERFFAARWSDAEVRDEFFPGKVVADYAAGDTRQWSLSKARRALRADEGWRDLIRPCLYRPFDWRVILYDRRMVDWPRPEVLGHMLEPNLCLLTNRQSKEEFAALCTTDIPERKIAAVYDASSSFPLYLYPSGATLALSPGKQPNFSNAFLKALALKLGLQPAGKYGLPEGLTPEDIFYYVYSTFYSPAYRRRYADFLRIDFPRLPLTGSLKLFRALTQLGEKLTALHLLESPKLTKPITEFIGSRNPEVERISWSKNTVWVDKAQTIGFRGVPEAVWMFHIGGYQVCEKWLKDRKGRKLLKADIEHYQKIVVALSETIRIMKEIDEVIEKHGGWPGAFQVSNAYTEAPLALRKVAEQRSTYAPKVAAEGEDT